MGHRFVTPRRHDSELSPPPPILLSDLFFKYKAKDPKFLFSLYLWESDCCFGLGSWLVWLVSGCLFVWGFFGGEFFERSDLCTIVFPLVFQKALIIRTSSTQWIPKMVKKLFVSKEWHGEFLSHLSECIKQNCCWWMVSRAYKILVRL